METEVEEETYSKVIYIVIGILSVIIFIIILDVMTGGNLFCTLVSSIVFYIPISGSTLAHYLRCFM